jgi:hypothetical protein
MKKLIITVLFALTLSSLQAQLKIQDLTGNWKIKSYTKNGIAQTFDNTYFRYFESDVGDPIIEQVFTKNNKERCNATCMISIDGNKIYHDYLMSSIEDDPTCGFWIPGEFIYELKSGILKISDKEIIIELQRK